MTTTAPTEAMSPNGDGPLDVRTARDDGDTAPDLDVLTKAHERTVDAAAGFEKMVEKAESEFRPVAERFLSLHQRHATVIAAILTRNGRSPDGDGTLMGSINRAVVATRAFFDEIDEDVMDQVRRGEARVIEAYEAAFNAGLSIEDRAEVVRLRNELADLLAETRHLD